MAVVYAWPPVSPTSWKWSPRDVVSESRSLITGRRYASRDQPRRRAAELVVAGARDDWAGYMEALKRLVEGGAKYVRLQSYPMLYAPPTAARGGGGVVKWTAGGETLTWDDDGYTLAWLSNALTDIVLTTASGFAAVRISGFPPGAKVAAVGEPVSFFAAPGDLLPAQSRTVLRAAHSDDSGVATIVLDDAPTAFGRVVVGWETAVFEVTSVPDPQRTVGQNWFYDWQFLEVFSDEVGGFDEVDPWV